jgi:translation initiation factor IF-1
MMDTKDKLIFDGVVEEFSNGKFTVKINEGYRVLATLSGKIRQNAVRIIVGDFVQVEVSAYDPQMGRIIYRLKQE